MSRSASVGTVASLLLGWTTVTALAACAALGAEPATALRVELRGFDTAIRLHSHAVVTNDVVRLSDVAELRGEAIGLAGSWVVTVAPAVGSTKRVTLEQVERVLSQKGANLSEMKVCGSSHCLVNHPRNRVPAGTQPAGDVPGSSSLQAGNVIPNRGEPGVDPASLEAAVRSHLAQKLSGLGGVPVIKFSSAAAKVLALKRPQYAFEVTDRGDSPLGWVSVEVAISERGKLVQTVPMVVQLSLKKQVVVAARAINRSQRIEPDDLMLAERTFDRVEDIGLSETGPLIGQQAKRPIPRGDQIATRDAEPVPLIQRNDLVTVWVRLGGVTVRGGAKAMGSGTYGQMVTLKNEASKQTFTATVTGPRTAEVVSETVAASADGIREQVR